MIPYSGTGYGYANTYPYYYGGYYGYYGPSVVVGFRIWRRMGITEGTTEAATEDIAAAGITAITDIASSRPATS